MPQIWMTYDEVAELVGCDAYAARERAIERRLDRRRSRDGNTRVKLDHAWTTLFVARIRDTDDALDRAIRDLRGIHREMARTQDQAPIAAQAGF